MTISAAARRKTTPEQYIKGHEKTQRRAEQRRQTAPAERKGAALQRAISHSVMERKRLVRLEAGQKFLPVETLKALADMRLPPSIDEYNRALNKLLEGNRKWKRKQK